MMKPHPWFNPPYRRALTVAFCVLWLVLELWHEPSSMWVLLSGGAIAYAVYDFYLAGHYPVPAPATEPKAGQSKPGESA